MDPKNILAAGHEHGLKHLADSARSLRKPMTITEWSLGGDERPLAWRDLLQFVNDPENRIWRVGYWDKACSTRKRCDD